MRASRCLILMGLIGLIYSTPAGLFAYDVEGAYSTTETYTVEECETVSDGWDCPPVYDPDGSCTEKTKTVCRDVTKTRSVTRRTSTTIDGPTPGEINGKVSNLEKMPGDVEAAKDEAAETLTDAQNQVIQAAGKNNDQSTDENAANAKIGQEGDKNAGETAEENGTPVGDPVKPSLGNFVTSAKDLSYSSPRQELILERQYSSRNRLSGSLGVGWNFSADTRIIRGVRPDAEALFTQAQNTATTIAGWLSASEAKYRDAVATYDDLVADVQEIEDQIDRAINSLIKALGTAHSALHPQLNANLAHARAKKGEAEAIIKKMNLPALKTTLDAIHAEIEKLRAEHQKAQSALERARNHWELSRSHQQLNAYHETQGSVASHYRDTGIGTLTWVTPQGVPVLYRMEEAPDYSSTSRYANREINYWPTGSRLSTDTPAVEEITLGADGFITVEAKKGISYRYNLSGQLASVSSPSAGTLSYSYNAQKRLSAIEDDFGGRIAFTWTGNRITGISAPGKVSVSYSYKASGELIGVTDPDGDEVGYLYDGPGGELTRITKADGSYREYSYKEQEGRNVVVKTQDEEKAAEEFEYDFAKAQTTYTSPGGVEIIYHYDERHRESAVEYSDGSRVEKSYDSQDRLILLTDRHKKSTRYSYDDRNNITRIDHPDGKWKSYTYNDQDQILEHRDSEGHFTRNSYTAGRLIRREVVDATGALYSRESYSYNSDGLLTQKQIHATDTPLTEGYAYDSAGRMISRTDAEGHLWSYAYNAQGRLSVETNPLGKVWKYSYSPTGRPTAITHPDGSREEWQYNNRKDLVRYSDREDAVTKYEYDHRHLLTGVDNPLGEQLKLTYNPAGDPLTRELLAADETSAAAWRYRYDPNTGDLVERSRRVDADEWVSEEWRYLKGRVVSRSDERGLKKSYQYDSRGRVSRLVESGSGSEKSRVQSFLYDGKGQLIQWEDAAGSSTGYRYSPTGTLQRIDYPDGSREIIQESLGFQKIAHIDEDDERTQHRYDGRGLLVETIHPGGASESWNYDAGGNLVAYTDPTGVQTRYESDFEGRITARILPSTDESATAREEYRYNHRGQLTLYTDPTGHQHRYSYDLLGRPVRYINPLDEEIRYHYSPRGQVVKIVDAAGHEHRREYDDDGRMIGRTDPLGHSSSYRYDAGGLLVEEKNPAGEATEYRYNSFGEVIRRIDPLGLGEEYAYDPTGLLLSEGPIGGALHRYRYDVRGRLILEINALGDEQSYRYSLEGQLLEKKDFGGAISRYSYDQDDRLVAKKFPLDATESYRYDAAGRLTQAVNTDAELYFSYDERGSLIKSGDTRRDRHIRYGYDAAGRRTSLVWAEGMRQVGYEYDAAGRMVRLIPPDSGAIALSYDERGLEVLRKGPGELERHSRYDASGRLIRVEYDHPEERLYSAQDIPQPSVSYLYDEAGRRVLELDEWGRSTLWRYDDAGRLTETLSPWGVGKSAWDFSEHLHWGLFPETETDGDASALESHIGALELAGLPKGAFIAERYRDELKAAWEDAILVFPELDGDALEAASAMLEGEFIHREAFLGYADGLQEVVGDAYSPVELDRLLSQPHWRESYRYDDAGNLVEKSSPWGSIDYRYDAANRQLSAGNRHFEYDAKGNRIRESLGELEANYYYDAENRMRELSMNRPGFIGDPDVAVHQVLEYGYDALGRRVSRRELPMSREVAPGVYEADVSFGLVDRALDVVDRSYQYDGLSFHRLGEWRKREDAPIVYTTDWKENFRAEYETLMAGDRLVMRSKLDNPEARWGDVRYASSKKSYYGQDVLGSVAVLFDHHGHVDARMHYDSWGNETTGNLHDMDAVGYNGKRRDEMSGLYDYGFRDYLPEGGRWMTLDPIRDGSNWYAYVGNDPINFVDPWGLSAESPEDDGEVGGTNPGEYLNSSEMERQNFPPGYSSYEEYIQDRRDNVRKVAQAILGSAPFPQEMDSIPQMFEIPAEGIYTSEFTDDRTNLYSGETVEHGAVDIANKDGTPLTMMKDGVLIDSGKTGTFGYYQTFSHPDGTKSRLSHQQYPSSYEEGKRFRQGQVVGYMGNTGNSTGPHVDITIWNDENKKVDPAPLLDLPNVGQPVKRRKG